jgi:hypothetical protein
VLSQFLHIPLRLSSVGEWPRARSLDCALFVYAVCNGDAQTASARRASTGDRLDSGTSVLAPFASCLTEVNFLPGYY